MKHTLFLLLIGFGLEASPQIKLTEIKNFGPNTGNLRCYGYNTEKASGRPLVLLLHGCGQNALQIARISGWTKLADLYNWVLIFPDQKLINNPTYCFNWFNNGDASKDRGEVSSIYNMVQYAKQTLKVDSTRIFIYGVSAGGAMAVSAMVCYPDLFAGGASLAGGPYGMATSGMEILSERPHKESSFWVSRVKEQNPSYIGKYPALVILHGTDDELVNISRSETLASQWCRINGLDTVPTIIQENFFNENGLQRTTWGDRVVFYRLKGLGHRLPIKTGTAPDEGGERGLFSVYSEFHSTWHIANDWNLID